MAVWHCKVGFADRDSFQTGVNITPDDAMRSAVEQAYHRLTGFHPHFVFSAWEDELSEVERAAVEDRQPDPAKMIPERVAAIRQHFEGGESLPRWTPEQWASAALVKLGEAMRDMHEGTYGPQYEPASPEKMKRGIENLLAAASVLMDAAEALSEPDPTVTLRLGIPEVNDRVLAEIRGVASQLGLPLSEALALLVGLGHGKGQEAGLIGSRVLEPMTREELLRQLQKLLSEDDD